MAKMKRNMKLLFLFFFFFCLFQQKRRLLLNRVKGVEVVVGTESREKFVIMMEISVHRGGKDRRTIVKSAQVMKMCRLSSGKLMLINQSYMFRKLKKLKNISFPFLFNSEQRGAPYSQNRFVFNIPFFPSSIAVHAHGVALLDIV